MYAVYFLPATPFAEKRISCRNRIHTEGKTGIAKHKEQLKMLFFNPGKRIPGLPFIGNKVALFDEDVAESYDFTIDMNEYKGKMCYVFRMIPGLTTLTEYRRKIRS